MEDLQRLLRATFRTENSATFAITGAGTAAMEAALVNALQPGQHAVVGVHGYFGDRMRQILERAGAQVEVVESTWGEPIRPEAVAEALRKVGTAAVVALVHGETSTGVQQPIPEIAKMAHDHGALLVVDTVASLGGTEFSTDAWGADIVYTGGQKCLSVPPGCSPITFGEEALARARSRERPCQSWYLDVLLNLSYWDQPHKYHHTGPINLTYALYEGLRILEERGLDRQIAHTRTTAEAMWAGFEAMGLELLVSPSHRLPTLTTLKVPQGVDEAKVRGYLMQHHGIEIAGGLGVLAGRTWRIGLMGASCQPRYVVLLLAALEAALRAQGHTCPQGAGPAAASDRLFG